ncbi:sulfite exporter TauE/SafE family protein [Alteromonas gilva]|uniref:Probable membrane transporter protein n=1 Tax=Alteromonas gilva TaxID=2987522 RepID=A0ABT5L5X6_9ALTE|nr:sulfite exporter TauE/SafE family protein [Alteromonas gilva]MDC8831881.1 sulfite exporter TauE/SafE family protein [Alteromonas gilva]
MEWLTHDLISAVNGSILIVLAGLTSFITAAFGAGGGLLLLVVMASILPMSIVIPVHGLVQLGSNANRALMTCRYIDKSMLVYFTLGGSVGALLASFIVADMPLELMKVLVGVFVLYLLWGVTPGMGERSALGRIVFGALTSFISMFVGASGPLVGSVMHTYNYEKMRFIATFSSCMTLQHCLKALLYGALGFAFWQWLPLIMAMIVSGTLGTWLGLKLLHKLPAEKFKRIFKIMLSLLAAQLIFQALWSV